MKGKYNYAQSKDTAIVVFLDLVLEEFVSGEIFVSKVELHVHPKAGRRKVHFDQDLQNLK